jgi:hypothetical protein
MRPDWFHYRTHCAVSGTTQHGKSKFAELCCRTHVRKGNGFAVIDYGTLADDLYDYLCYAQPYQPVVYLNLSEPDSVTQWNPFALRPGVNLSAHATRLTSLLGKVWGAGDMNELPQTALVSGWFEESAMYFFRLSPSYPQAVHTGPLRKHMSSRANSIHLSHNSPRLITISSLSSLILILLLRGNLSAKIAGLSHNVCMPVAARDSFSDTIILAAKTCFGLFCEFGETEICPNRRH